MIDTDELRRKVNSTDIVDHIDLHANIKSILSELIDRLEAAEKKRDALRAELSKQQALTDAAQHIAEVAQSRANRLRAKVEQMERQEPIGKFIQHPSNGLWEQDGYGDNPDARSLYALPGAKGE